MSPSFLAIIDLNNSPGWKRVKQNLYETFVEPIVELVIWCFAIGGGLLFLYVLLHILLIVPWDKWFDEVGKGAGDGLVMLVKGAFNAIKSLKHIFKYAESKERWLLGLEVILLGFAGIVMLVNNITHPLWIFVALFTWWLLLTTYLYIVARIKKLL